MFKSFLIGVIFFFGFFKNLNAQDALQFFFGDSLFYASDIAITEEEIHILAGVEYFKPPYPPGTPIEGDPKLGILFLRLDLIGTLLNKTFIPRTPSVYPFSIGSLLYKGDKAFFSNQANFFWRPCIDGGSSFTQKRSIIQLNGKDSDYSFLDSIYNEHGYCERPEISGSTVIGEYIWMIDSDNYPNIYEGPLIFQKISTKSLSRTVMRSGVEWFYCKGVFSLNDSHIYLLVKAKENSDGYGEIIKYDTNADSIMAAGNLLSSPAAYFVDGLSAVTSDQKVIVSVTQINKHYLVKFDADLNKLWEVALPSQPIEFKSTATGEILLLRRTKRMNDNTYTVSLLDREGKILAEKEYGLPTPEGRFLPTAIAFSEEDQSFAVTGTYLTSRQASTWGNPFARIFVLKDRIANLNIVGIDEIKNEADFLQIFPNPTTGLTTFVFESEFSDGVIKVFDLSGRQLILQELTVAETETDLSHLQTGMYLVMFISKTGKSFSQKILKK